MTHTQNQGNEYNGMAFTVV